MNIKKLYCVKLSFSLLTIQRGSISKNQQYELKNEIIDKHRMST